MALSYSVLCLLECLEAYFYWYWNKNQLIILTLTLTNAYSCFVMLREVYSSLSDRWEYRSWWCSGRSSELCIYRLLVWLCIYMCYLTEILSMDMEFYGLIIAEIKSHLMWIWCPGNTQAVRILWSCGYVYIYIVDLLWSCGAVELWSCEAVILVDLLYSIECSRVVVLFVLYNGLCITIYHYYYWYIIVYQISLNHMT